MSRSRIWASRELLEDMIREARRWAPLETRGMLVGYVDAEHPMNICVTSLIWTGPRAVRQRARIPP